MDLGCSCPDKLLDDGSRGLSVGDVLNSVSSVDVSPCDLKSVIGMFCGFSGAGMDDPIVVYTLTVMLQSSLIDDHTGEKSEDVL